MSKQTDEVQADVKAWQAKEHDVYEYRYNNYIVCPNCGYEHDDSDLDVKDGDMFSCRRCDFNFKVTVDISVTYSTA